MRLWCARNIFFILKPDFASRRSFFAGRLLLVPLLFRYLTLASRFLYLYFAARCLVLSVAAPYSLYSAHRTCSCSLVVDRWADSSTLFSDWCSSLRAILRSCRHTLFPADSLHSPIASFRSFLLATSFYLLPFDSSLLVGPFLLLSVIYWPPAFLCLFLASRCLLIFLISRRTNCMLLVSPKLANHISPFASGCCLSSPADRWTQLAHCSSILAAWYPFLATHFSSLSRCRLLDFWSILLASYWSQLVSGL